MQVPSYALAFAGADTAGGSGGFKGQNVTVAVIDGEFDVDHPDLAVSFRRDSRGDVIGRNVEEGHDDVRPIEQRIASPRLGIQDNGAVAYKKRAEREWGANFSRSISHGTHVAGIIGARPNGIGTIGIAPQATLVPITLFRSFDSPNYNRYGLSVFNDPDLIVWNQKVAKAVTFASHQRPFVINNSWGYPWFPDEAKATIGRQTKYFRLPNFFPSSSVSERINQHRQIFSPAAIAAWERAVEGEDGAAVVFAAGNDGWNSETGKHKVFSIPLGNRGWVDYRDDKYEYIRTKLRRVELTSTPSQFVDVPANIPGLESSYFLTNPKLRGAWLAVVNVDKRSRIALHSNGCGIAKDYCLAAPGMYVMSTLARGDQDDIADRPEARKDIGSQGDVDYETGDGYGTYSGTSMAAPLVSGALAVLKSKHPQMTAREAVRIVLCTATDLDKSTGRPTKSIEECADKGPAATHANGWAPSEVGC